MILGRRGSKFKLLILPIYNFEKDNNFDQWEAEIINNCCEACRNE